MGIQAARYAEILAFTKADFPHILKGMNGRAKEIMRREARKEARLQKRVWLVRLHRLRFFMKAIRQGAFQISDARRMVDQQNVDQLCA